MKYSELPEEIRKKLDEELNQLKNKLVTNNAFEISLYSKKGTRYFHARRHVCSSRVGKNKEYDFRFGGKNYWEVSYWGMGVREQKNPFGEKEYHLHAGIKYGSKTNSKGEVIEIPKELDTKAEVLKLIEALEVFDMNLLRK